MGRTPPPKGRHADRARAVGGLSGGTAVAAARAGRRRPGRSAGPLSCAYRVSCRIRPKELAYPPLGGMHPERPDRRAANLVPRFGTRGADSAVVAYAVVAAIVR